MICASTYYKVGFDVWGVMLFGIILAAGCTSVALRHPETGEMVQCGPYLGDPASDHSVRVLNRGCIEDYEKRGYERVMP